MKTFIVIIFSVLGLLAAFVIGVVAGNTYNISDFLCPLEETPYVLETDFVSTSGITFPKGTVIPIRECAYMQRATIQFVIDNSIKLNKYKGDKKKGHGFAELSPKDEAK